MTSELDKSAADWNKRQKKAQSTGKLFKALIYLALVIVAVGVFFWLRPSDKVVVAIILVLAAGYELDKVNNKLDAISESVAEVRDSLDELAARFD